MLKLTELVESIVEVNGVKVINTTPYPIRLTNEELTLDVTVEASGILINAGVETTPTYSCIDNVTLQMTEFIADKETKETIQDFLSEYPDVIIIGSMIAAQAYPGLVVAMVAHPDFMMVPPQEKRMLYNKFTVYPGRPDFE